MTSLDEPGEVQPGTLYLVPTPIGNLGDMSPRARRVLLDVDIIAAEDTRTTKRLFQALHMQPGARLVSCHDHNEAQRAAELVGQMQTQGASVALVSDAGTPGCSDPGFRLVQAAVEAGVTVVPLPGPAAFLCALVASGLPTDQFIFVGFLPASGGKRRARLEGLRDQPATLCLYEAPHRVLEVLGDIAEVLGPQRRVCLGRELTKRYEELLRGTAAEVRDTLAARDAIKGEIALVIEGAGEAEAPPEGIDPEQAAALRRLIEVLGNHGLSPRDIKQIAADHFGLRPKEVYQVMLSMK